MSNKQSNLIWLDLEMTGLNPDKDKIIEIATIVTDCQLNILAVGPEIAIFQTDYVLDGMDNWNIEQHTRSGLLNRVRSSAVSEAEAEKQTLDFLVKHVAPNASPMCGSSICQDRRFLFRDMSKLEKFFHYRNLDVSTVKILVKCWLPELLKGFAKSNNHRALDDVKESIEELKFYKKHFINI